MLINSAFCSQRESYIRVWYDSEETAFVSINSVNQLFLFWGLVMFSLRQAKFIYII
jgi:hypothetical protein